MREFVLHAEKKKKKGVMQLSVIAPGTILAGVVREVFWEEVTLKEGSPSCRKQGKGIPGRMNSKHKGPEEGSHLVCSRK